MKRRLCQIAAIACMLFCGAAVALWIRSESLRDVLSSPTWAMSSCAVQADCGGLTVVIVLASTSNLAQGGQWEVIHTKTPGPKFFDAYHRFLGFGYDNPAIGSSTGIACHLYMLCIPLWFVALLSLLFAYFFPVPLGAG